MRMCVFPKSYQYNHNEPPFYPFGRDAAGKSDFTRLNPAFFANIERRIADLRAMGIEADLILFHPYDRWGYATMPAEADDRYLRYLLARHLNRRKVSDQSRLAQDQGPDLTLMFSRFCHEKYGGDGAPQGEGSDT